MSRGADLEEIFALSGFVTDDRRGGHNVAAQVNRRLADSSQVEGAGLDFMIKATTAGGNPKVLQSSFISGVDGHGMIPGHPHDCFGLGGFGFNGVNALQEGRVLRP